MKEIRIICPGKTKSDFINAGINEYIKFLKSYAKIELIQIKQGTGNRENIINEESDRILEKIKEDITLLDIQGKNLSSEEFSQFINKENKLNFVIGGHLGVSDKLKQKAKYRISLSKMTFTHEMSRLILLEQIYRAFAILKGKKYHY